MRQASTQGRDGGPECDIDGRRHVLVWSAVLEAQVITHSRSWRRTNDDNTPGTPLDQSRTAHTERGPVHCPLREPRCPADRGTALDAHPRYPAPSWPELRPGVCDAPGDAPAGRPLRHATDLWRERCVVPECAGGRWGRRHLSRD